MITTYLFECRGAIAATIADPALVLATLKQIAEFSDLHVMSETTHQFQPQGVSAALVLAESHIAVHTWPETQSAYILLASCKNLTSEGQKQIEDYIQQVFGNCNVTTKVLA